jgi:hypothetical protein
MRIFETTRIECHYDSYHLRMALGAETCSEILKNKEVVSCVCGPHIYTFILYVYIVYVSNTAGCTPQRYRNKSNLHVKCYDFTYIDTGRVPFYRKHASRVFLETDVALFFIKSSSLATQGSTELPLHSLDCIVLLRYLATLCRLSRSFMHCALLRKNWLS